MMVDDDDTIIKYLIQFKYVRKYLKQFDRKFYKVETRDEIYVEFQSQTRSFWSIIWGGPMSVGI